jgi:hypothetical protein
MWGSFFSMIPPTIGGPLWHKPSGISSPPSTITAVGSCMGICGTRRPPGPHIVAQKAVLTQFGCPLTYYVDNHSIFRYVERRDSVWRKFETMEEQAVVQWKEVLRDLSIEVIYAMSPAAKGKVERPSNGCRITWSGPASGRESRASIKLGKCSTKNFISTTTNESTRLPEKSRSFVMKRLLRKTEACFGGLKSPGLIRPLMIFSVTDSKGRWTLIERSPGTL